MAKGDPPAHDDGRSRHQEASQAFGLAGALAEQSRGLREVVEDEQKGKSRAAYGKQVLIHLSARLIEKHGEGWSVENFYFCYFLFCLYAK